MPDLGMKSPYVTQLWPYREREKMDPPSLLTVDPAKQSASVSRNPKHVLRCARVPSADYIMRVQQLMGLVSERPA